jgi:hypothetical protein
MRLKSDMEIKYFFHTGNASAANRSNTGTSGPTYWSAADRSTIQRNRRCSIPRRDAGFGGIAADQVD